MKNCRFTSVKMNATFFSNIASKLYFQGLALREYSEKEKTTKSQNKDLETFYYQIFTVLLLLLMSHRNSKWTIMVNLSPTLWSNQCGISKVLLVILLLSTVTFCFKSIVDCKWIVGYKLWRMLSRLWRDCSLWKFVLLLFKK